VKATIAFGLLYAVGFFAMNDAHASDRELRAILDRVACVPDRVVPNRLSRTLVVYEVTCRQSARTVQVECLGTECRLLPSPRDDDVEG